MLVVACMQSRWCEAYALPSPTHQLVAACFLDWFSRHGVPEQIHTDQGSQFMAESLAEAYEQLGIKRTRTTPYHPSGDPAERMIGAIVRVLRALVYENLNNADWDELLPIVLMCLRSQVIETMRVSPYEVVHGMQMRLPIDHIFATEPESRTTPLHDLPVRLQRLRERISKYQEQQRDRYKKKYDKSRKDVTFHVGDEVLLH